MTAPRPRVPIHLTDATTHRLQLAQAMNNVQSGWIDVTITVTLAVTSGSTTIQDSRIGPTTAILLMPTTANAAAALATTYIPVPGSLSVPPGTAIIFHQSLPSTDRTFVAALLG